MNNLQSVMKLINNQLRDLNRKKRNAPTLSDEYPYSVAIDELQMLKEEIQILIEVERIKETVDFKTVS